MNNNQNNPMTFPQFMQMMRGKNPYNIINPMMNSGQINQQQLNFIQQRANEMKGHFDQFKGMFGFQLQEK